MEAGDLSHNCLTGGSPGGTGTRQPPGHPLLPEEGSGYRAWKALYDHARRPAHDFERQLRDWNIRGVWDLKADVLAGRIPKAFHESDDPHRLVPIVWKPEDYMIAVTGDPLRNNAYVFAHNAFLGYPTGRKIRLRS